MRSRARELRRSMTLSERRLWNWLRNRTVGGCKFRRQMPIGPYVVHFYCAELKLAIEVDGRQHEAFWTAEYDAERTFYLESIGIEVVRVANELIARDAVTAEQVITAAIAARA